MIVLSISFWSHTKRICAWLTIKWNLVSICEEAEIQFSKHTVRLYERKILHSIIFLVDKITFGNCSHTGKTTAIRCIASCPRNKILTASWGTNWRPPWNLSDHYSTIKLRGLRVTIDLFPIMTANVFSFSPNWDLWIAQDNMRWSHKIL